MRVLKRKNKITKLVSQEKFSKQPKLPDSSDQLCATNGKTTKGFHRFTLISEK